ncbi:NUDIX hydrolase [Pelodictyon luteolum]|nr:NUDIX hydrolase [Pelodictyon luteolum]
MTGSVSMEAGRHEGASIIIHDGRGSVLLFLRDNIPAIPYPGMWDLPGGHIEPGETPYECIVREMLEEIETDVRECGLFRAYPFSDRKEHVFVIQRELRVRETVLHEGQMLRWFTKRETEETALAYGFNRVLREWFEEFSGSFPDTAQRPQQPCTPFRPR